MARRKTGCEPIVNERVTLSKRRLGLFKKAYELSMLCKCEVGIVIRCERGRWYDYATNDMDELLLCFTKEYSNVSGNRAQGAGQQAPLPPSS